VSFLPRKESHDSDPNGTAVVMCSLVRNGQRDAGPDRQARGRRRVGLDVCSTFRVCPTTELVSEQTERVDDRTGIGIKPSSEQSTSVRPRRLGLLALKRDLPRDTSPATTELKACAARALQSDRALLALAVPCVGAKPNAFCQRVLSHAALLRSLGAYLQRPPADQRVLALDGVRDSADLAEAETLPEPAARIALEHELEEHRVETMPPRLLERVFCEGGADAPFAQISGHNVARVCDVTREPGQSRTDEIRAREPGGNPCDLQRRRSVEPRRSQHLTIGGRMAGKGTAFRDDGCVGCEQLILVAVPIGRDVQVVDHLGRRIRLRRIGDLAPVRQ
jgi:hypothetical protein